MTAVLPIHTVLPELKETLATEHSALLTAPTGSGKTTVVPVALLREDWLAGKKILLLEPRRLAARLAASFMAGQMGEQVGETIGYRVRFDQKISPKTRVEVITEGVLTRHLQQDPELDGVGLIIFDEFHERSLEGDLALALCLDIQEGLREDLRLLIMSATLEGDTLSTLFDGAPVIRGEGKLYPVEICYLPPPADLDSPRPDHIARMTVRGVLQALKEQSGDLLVFLPGRGEIHRVMEGLAPIVADDTIVLPLYGAMKLSEQTRAVRPDSAGRRRVIVTTTIAETSLTIEGITAVVDCGWKRVPRFDATCGLSRLETVRISRASAQQRSGRAGRLGPGTCYRLWSKGVELGLQPFDRPEILQADLAPLVLELALWGVHSPDQLRWLDPPDPHAVAKAGELLFQLEALDGNGALTKIGRKMAGLPVHPRLAHMLLQTGGIGSLRLACDIAALISERDFLRNADSVDIEDRLFVLDRFRQSGKRGGRAGGSIIRQVDRVSRQLVQLVKKQAGSETGTTSSPGGLLSLAYPDRIAAQRPESSLKYQLVSGRGAVLPPHDRLQTTPFLVVAAMDGGRRDGRVFLAASLERKELLDLHGRRCCRTEEVFYDRQQQVVRALQRMMLGKMEVARKPVARPDPENVRIALLAEIRRTELQLLPWNRESRELQQRILSLRCWQLGSDWPDLSNAGLMESLEHWLGPYLNRMKTAADVRALRLEEILRNQMEWKQQQRLEQEAPTHIRVPSGSRVRLQYRAGEPPILPVRLQEMFGLEETPTVCRGRVKVLLHLLSPARRPVQITDDLKGFWEGSYHQVKKEFKGRYPKHFWPDDPLQAKATSRVKPRSA